jgi:hypothetical protein
MNVPAYGSEPGKPKTKWIVGSAIVVLVFACGLVGLFTFVIGPRLFPFMYGGGLPISSDPAKSSGPSKTMAEMLALAQQEAKKIDPDAVLSDVSASTPGYLAGLAYPGPATGGIDVTFEFRRPTKQRLSIEFEDSNPQGTLDINIDDYVSEYDQLYTLAQEREKDLLDMLAAFKLSPRDAIAKTWDDSREYAQKNGVSVDQVLPMILIGPTKDGVPRWRVDYRYHKKRSSIALGEIFDLSGEIVDYTVDGVTGEITEADYQTVSPTPTTAP